MQLIYCYTQPQPVNCLLKETLAKYRNSDSKLFWFENKELFLDALRENRKTIPELIILQFFKPKHEDFDFIRIVNQQMPGTVKLVIADPVFVQDFQKKNSDKASLLFLNNNYDRKELEIMLDMSQSISHLLDKEAGYKSDKIVREVEKQVKEKLSKLVDANTSKEKMLLTIAHDLKSPFTGLTGLMDILLQNWNSTEEYEKKKLISDAKKMLNNTYKLLVELLEWANCQREKFEITLNEILVHQLVDATIELNSSCALPKGIVIQNNINKNIKVKADHHLIAAVFRNLISNAVKFTPPGGNIEVYTYDYDNQYYTFCVSDNGIGISKPHILEMFSKKYPNGNGKDQEQAQNGKEISNYPLNSVNGGLGLLICKDFVECGGGSMWLETQRGLGSKFYFTVPAN
ncbi:MAG: hypothetical protein CR996_01315 [Draconibacterium sp.]|nr:MAG: hypothetical protein CR996_01315 [Draconibacterium sp.]PIF05550.1 MAG: hypothetical protein CSA36_06030 [Draconibacterium sp.]